MEDSESLREKFKKADVDGTGMISLQELRVVFDELGQWTDKDFQNLLVAADMNNDGKLCYNDFIDWLMEGRAAKVGTCETSCSATDGAEVILLAAASGTEITRIQPKPEALVSSLRRAAAAAGAGGDVDLRCGLRLICDGRMLRDGETLEAACLTHGGAVDVVTMPSLEFWRENKIIWRTIKVPVSGPLCEYAAVRPVCCDRILAFPGTPAWRHYDREAETTLKDFIGPYVVKRFESSDIWLIGANEPSEAYMPDMGTRPAQTNGGFLGMKCIPLPIVDPEHQAIHCFDFCDGVATVLLAPGQAGEEMLEQREGIVQKFRLCSADEEDLGAAHFELDGDPRPLKFQFPSVSEGDRPKYYRSIHKFDFEASEGKGNGTGRFQVGRNRCGQIVAMLGDMSPEDWRVCQREFPFQVCELGDDGSVKSQLAAWRVKGHVNQGCQALGYQLMLFAGAHGGEDAFYKHMNLVEWNSGQVLREIPLEIEHRFIENEWPRGILPGITQTFYTAWTSEDYTFTNFAFATPEA